MRWPVFDNWKLETANSNPGFKEMGFCPSL